MLFDMTNKYKVNKIGNKYLSIKDNKIIDKIISHKQEIFDIQFSNDGLFLYSFAKDGIKKWRTFNGKNEFIVYKNFKYNLNNKCLFNKFILNENSEYMFCPINNKIIMYDNKNGNEVNTLNYHFVDVCCIDYTSKYNQLISGDINGNILVFSPKIDFDKHQDSNSNLQGFTDDQDCWSE